MKTSNRIITMNIVTGIYLACIILSCFTTCALANIFDLANMPGQTQKRNQELKNVTSQIQGLQQNLQQEKNQRSELITQLRTIELTIGHTANKLARIDKNLHSQQQVLTGLKVREQDYNQQLQEQQGLLGQQIYTQYSMGKNQYIKLLLNQKDPNQISRIVEYYQYIAKARMQLIDTLNITLKELVQNEMQIKIHRDELQKLDSQQNTEKQTLLQQLQDRKLVLTQLDASIKTKSEHLLELMANKKALENLINRLNQQHIIIEQPKIPFDKMRHKLHWPTVGHITQYFDTRIADSELTYNGVFIAAPTGQPIKAVYPGTVIFADWLRGVGLLVIIDHSRGFMTLYGHNNSLKVKVGDAVFAGETIATVGNSGGVPKSGLYFQIRDNGKPLNPEVWCR